MKTSFRIQTTIRNFAFGFAASAALAGCASDGSVKPSAQQQLVRACDNAQTALTLAGFFADKMTPREADIYKGAQVVVPKVCNPSALAADLTPDAVQANLRTLAEIVDELDQASGAATPPLPASVGSTT